MEKRNLGRLGRQNRSDGSKNIIWNNNTKSPDIHIHIRFFRIFGKFNPRKSYPYPNLTGSKYFLSGSGYYRIWIRIFSDNILSIFTPNYMRASSTLSLALPVWSLSRNAFLKHLPNNLFQNTDMTKENYFWILLHPIYSYNFFFSAVL